MHIPRPSLVAAASFAALLAGCGGGSSKSTTSSSTPTPTASGSSLTVSEKQYSLTPSNLRVAKSGKVTVTARNNGTIVHALVVEGKAGESRTPDIQPGKSATLRLNLKPGSYEIYCPIDGHKGLGMKGTLVVAKAGASGAGSAAPKSSGSNTSGGSGGGGGY